MNVNGKRLAAVLVLCATLAFAAGYAVQNSHVLLPASRGRPVANLYLTIETPMGSYDLLESNLITDIGEQQVATRMRANASYVHVGWISLSNDASANAAWTQLPNEASANGSARAKGTISDLWTYSGDAAFNVTHKFTFSGTTPLQCAGAQWADAGDNNLYAAANFAQTTFEANWNLTIRWVFTFDGN